MQITTRQILRLLYILSWIIFFGLCIQGGGFIFNAIFTHFLNPVRPGYFWKEIDMSSIYQFDAGHFFVQVFFMIIVTVMKAWIFYLIIKILHEKKLDMAQPFNKETGRFIFNVSYLSLLIGLFSIWGRKYSEWLISQGAAVPDVEHMALGGADVWLFMSVILFVIAQIFKRGIEIQSENELTV